ncbi:MAG: ABC transporter ATP-binding protein [Acidimicrobiia bacterium]|nr:ABC transporter ATP-binding protein [Acidimicrobiia bacterium]MBT8192907.1 ABC transporter ATP-binding protein [Acidimicrobiia bacterium]NNF89690.1 ABC transporter ATP-binding protein [Acidimicrobiia bacterium]NNL14185.1 ABC transporter ATP-binding protein [Acidimicrobiia bacterium]NNL48880.1 ABC transporter ATP-binding protein [Acidimicrobiia bacterium]
MTTPLVEDSTGGLKTGDTLLEVENLIMRYKTKQGYVSAVEDVSFVLHKGEALGLVGESGCGKTSVALSLLRLQADNGEIIGGEIRLGGENLVALSEDDMRKRRWDDISMVFQGAMNSWNPVYRVGDQIKEALDLHWPTKLSRAEARERIGDLFALVGLPSDAQDRYPHEFSGGMRQRATIAMALSCNPQVIIADEPTTALDVIVQDQILKELKKIQADLDMSIIYISHDIAVIAEVTDRMGVMYAGKMVEFGNTADIFSAPRHPYAWLLLSSTPSIVGPRRQLAPLEGEPPNLLDPPSGCRFNPRCPFATEQCRTEEPPLQDIGDGHLVACWNYEEVPVGITAGGVV